MRARREDVAEATRKLSERAAVLQSKLDAKSSEAAGTMELARLRWVVRRRWAADLEREDNDEAQVERLHATRQELQQAIAAATGNGRAGAILSGSTSEALSTSSKARRKRRAKLVGVVSFLQGCIKLSPYSVRLSASMKRLVLRVQREHGLQLPGMMALRQGEDEGEAAQRKLTQPTGIDDRPKVSGKGAASIVATGMGAEKKHAPAEQITGAAGAISVPAPREPNNAPDKSQEAGDGTSSPRSDFSGYSLGGEDGDGAPPLPSEMQSDRPRPADASALGSSYASAGGQSQWSKGETKASPAPDSSTPARPRTHASTPTVSQMAGSHDRTKPSQAVQALVDDTLSPTSRHSHSQARGAARRPGELYRSPKHDETGSSSRQADATDGSSSSSPAAGASEPKHQDVLAEEELLPRTNPSDSAEGQLPHAVSEAGRVPPRPLEEVPRASKRVPVPMPMPVPTPKPRAG